eukprot:TRINITY_DN3069_c0_g2_i1.p1 TRINITY_DN3069_c0_g2~~TRINITY_DN3069_c0_g2_i1.p1  ORF type:complete len:111 (-),score=19.02 TRINITY_DN3069_c0_g2_i1:166-498(-)
MTVLVLNMSDSTSLDRAQQILRKFTIEYLLLNVSIVADAGKDNRKHAFEVVDIQSALSTEFNIPIFLWRDQHESLQLKIVETLSRRIENVSHQAHRQNPVLRWCVSNYYS